MLAEVPLAGLPLKTAKVEVLFALKTRSPSFAVCLRSYVMKFSSILLAACLLLTVASTQSPAASLEEHDDGEFTASNGKKLLFALVEPEDMGAPPTAKRAAGAKAAAGARYPLVIFLHGAGGQAGYGQRKGRSNDGGSKLFQSVVSLGQPCYFFMPQAFDVWAGIGWGNVPYTMNPQPTDNMQAVIECIEALIQEKAIDPDRVYVTGTSMGSMGMWDLVSRRPDLFAAGVSCCGGFDADQAPRLTKIPFRIFHGDADTIVPIAGSQAMAEAIKTAGGAVDYTVLPGGSHFIWDNVYGNPAVAAWMFQQRRQAAKGKAGAATSKAGHDYRTWTPDKIKPFEGKFVKTLIVISRRSGSEVRLDEETLSPEDREFVRSLRSE
jgi:predicted esterase